MRIWLLGLGLITLACTDGGPEPLAWELDDAEEPIEAHAGYAHQPERERVVDPDAQPRFEVMNRDADPETDGLCPYDVEARGFPAISENSATVVELDAWSWADDMEETLDVIWLDAGATRVDPVFDRDEDRSGEDGILDCDAALVRVRGRVATLNAALERQTWRSLERLDAFYSAPGFGLAMDQTGYEDTVLSELAGPDRPIEVYWRNGHVIARVRGLTVLQDTPRPEWYEPDEFCVSDAQIFAIEFDRPSRAGLVRYTHSSGACLCDERDYVGRIELEPKLLAAIDQRSTAAFAAANAKALDSDGDALEGHAN